MREAISTHRRGPRGRPRVGTPICVALLALAVSGASESCPDTPDPPEEQEAEAVFIVPEVVHVKPGDEVILTARVLGYDDKLIVLPEWLRDETTGIESPNTDLEASWQFADPVSVGSAMQLSALPVAESPAKHRHRLTVADTATPGRNIFVEVTVGDKRDESAVVVTSPPTISTTLVVGTAPTADPRLLVREPVTGGPSWLLNAYSKSLKPADLTGSATVPWLLLVPGNRMTHSQGPALAAVNRPSLPAPYRVPLRFWLTTSGLVSGGSDCDSICRIKTRITEDLDLANQIFRRNGTGVQFFSLDGTEMLDAGPNALVVTKVNELPNIAAFNLYRCDWLRDRIIGTPPNAAVPILGNQVKNEHILHVIYTLGEVEGIRGLECTYGDATGFIMIYLMKRAPTSLAHELGHAMTRSDWLDLDGGHPSSSNTGFDAGNLMWAGLDLRQATDRSRLLVGQSAWMNIDTSSFLNLAVTDPTDPASPPVRPISSLSPRRKCGFADPDPCAPLSMRAEEAQ